MLADERHAAPTAISIRTSTRADDGPELAALLEASFPNTFGGRTFFKQQPHSRLLAFKSGVLVGQVGLDFRVINVGGHLLEIAGLIDLCVIPHARGRQVGSTLLRSAEACAEGRDYAVLMADDKRLYLRNGYLPVDPAPTRWFVIEELESHSVIERDLSDCLLAKSLKTQPWPPGRIDLLGYLF